jgi:DNA polymerase-3 subunit alpha (Gram-positive type)
VKNYYEERGQRKRGCEIERITEGCTGIRRSTGQHPGGIVVLPHGHSINEFTPVQHPANDMECGITTTHFDYHSIDHNLLKLDILGHDDPTMIRTLEDYITSDAMENEYNEEHPFVATEIPLDDKKVIELFHGTEILGIKPEDIDGCKLGCWNSRVWYRFRYPDGAGYKTSDVIRSDPNFRSVTWNERVARKCTGTCKIRKSNHFYGNLYP